MVRQARSISFDEETDDIVKEILQQDRGLLSKICQKAIRDWKGFELSEDELKLKIDKLELEFKEKEAEIEFYKKKLCECQTETELKKQKLQITQEEYDKEVSVSKRDKQINRNVEWAISNYKDIDEKIILPLAIEFVDNKDLRAKYNHDFANYLKATKILEKGDGK